MYKTQQKEMLLLEQGKKAEYLGAGEDSSVGDLVSPLDV